MNWQSMINEILATGMLQQELAKKLACGQTYISDLSNGKRGKRVSYDLGVRIINLHREYVTANLAAIATA